MIVSTATSGLISEPDSCLYISGEEGISGKEYSDTLHQVWYQSLESFFSFYSRERDSACHQGQGTCNHRIQRIGKFQEE
jgi:hypothetical protein